jgi:preprotein translocase subunit SecA
MFSALMDRIQTDTLERLFRVQAVKGEMPDPTAAPLAPQPQPRPTPRMTLNRGDQPVTPQAPAHRTEDKVGRNDPCPCGSGKKYKKCHGT